MHHAKVESLIPLRLFYCNMGEPQHSANLRNVNKGDSVTIETTGGRRFREVKCTDFIKKHADPRTGEIRETSLWEFDISGLGDMEVLTVSIVEGLKSSPDDPDFPVHKNGSAGIIGHRDSWESVGHFEEIEIHGSME